MRNEESFDEDPASETNPRVGSAARKVTEGLEELGRALSDRRQGLVEPLAEFVQERPLAAIGVAFGVGYVLAGGLFSRVSGRALSLGWRLGGMAFARKILSSLSEAQPEI